MMDIKSLAPEISVTSQVRVADLPAIKGQGFQSIICNRPDGEERDQPNYKDVEAAAAKLGIYMAYQPIVAGKVSDQNVDDFAKMIAELPGPVLAYCRTGMRSATLWSLAQTRAKAGS